MELKFKGGAITGIALTLLVLAAWAGMDTPTMMGRDITACVKAGADHQKAYDAFLRIYGGKP